MFWQSSPAAAIRVCLICKCYRLTEVWVGCSYSWFYFFCNFPWRCYTEKAEQAQQHPGTKTTSNPAEDNRTKQYKPNETKPSSYTILGGVMPLYLSPCKTPRHQLRASSVQCIPLRIVFTNRNCVVLQHAMHGFPGVAIWLSCMHTSN